MMQRPGIIVTLWWLSCGVAAADTLSLITWNVESGGAEPATIARELAELPRCDAYFLQEVSARDIGRYAAVIRRAHGNEYKHYLGSLGSGDRLAVVIDESRYRIRSFSELMSYDSFTLNDWRHRPPLVVEVASLQDGQPLLLVNVHLARGNKRLRTEQATGLREWARTRGLPVVLAGDCNFDYDFRQRRGNAAWKAFFAGGVWAELAPSPRIDTNWSDRNRDGRDDYPDSALDFVAVCSSGSQLDGECEVLVRDGDFPDTEATSDHRPVQANVIWQRDPHTEPKSDATKTGIRSRRVIVK